MFVRVLTVLLVGLTISLPAPSRAQQGEGDKAEASRAFAKGSKLFNERNYIAAIGAYELAYRLRPHFFVQCSIARCHQNLNDMVKAAKHFERCLKEGADKDPMAVRVRASLKAVSAQITWMMVNSPGRGGTIFVDGREVGPAPQKVPINPGTHVVEVRRSGADPARDKIKTFGGEERQLTLVPLELEPRSDPVPQPPPEPTPTAGGGLSSLWFWSAVGLTAALATVTTVLGIQTLGLKSDYNEQPTEAGADRFDQRRMLTNVFFGLTAAAGAGTTLLFFYTDFGGAREARDKEALVVGGGLRGTF